MPAPISFEAANPRHEHEWKVWEGVKLPDGQVLIPGVITHSSNIVEHPELIAERIGRFAKVVGARERHRRRRLRLRQLCRDQRGASQRRVDQARRTGRGRAHREQGVVGINGTPA